MAPFIKSVSMVTEKQSQTVVLKTKMHIHLYLISASSLFWQH